MAAGRKLSFSFYLPFPKSLFLSLCALLAMWWICCSPVTDEVCLVCVKLFDWSDCMLGNRLTSASVGDRPWLFSTKEIS